MESLLQCDTCKKVLSSKSNLKRHIRNMCGKKSNFKCDHCPKTFGCKEYLERHERKKHNKGTIRKTNLICNEDECLDSFVNMKAFRNHLKESHGKDTNKSTHQFPSLDEFNHWKDIIEAKTGIKYSKNWAPPKMGNKMKYTFYCRRSGVYTPRGTGKRHLKKQGSCKMGSYCSSTIELYITEGIYIVTHYEDHSGHTLDTKDLAHTLLPQSTKTFIVDKLANKVSKEDILDMVRKSMTDDRSHLIKYQDILNIERDFDLNSLESLQSKEIKQEKQKPHINKNNNQKGREPSESVYVKTGILDDPEAQRKHQNAIIGKHNREKQNNHLAELEVQIATLTHEQKELEAQVAILTHERDELKTSSEKYHRISQVQVAILTRERKELEAQVAKLTQEREELKTSSEKYRRRSQMFEEKLREVCNQFGVPIVIVTE